MCSASRNQAAGTNHIACSSSIMRDQFGGCRGNVHFISKQRITGNINGSSRYIVSMMNFLSKEGYKIHYHSPSPHTLGRWAIARLAKEISVFDTYTIRRTLKIGMYVFRIDPLPYVLSLIAAADRLCRKIGLPVQFGKRKPYSVATALTAQDCKFLARLEFRTGDIIFIDYAYLTPALDHIRRQGVPALVIMHDLLSSRAAQFVQLGQKDGVPRITIDEELKLLAKADLIVAIQYEEAKLVASLLPGHPVAVAPLAIEIEKNLHPGKGDAVLFVASMAAANVDAIVWFLNTVWPTFRTKHPEVRLDIVGSVGHELVAVPEGISVHGVVRNLDGFYRTASIVISPLRAGSGLKIKLIEAMAWGKAIIATPVTLQGVHQLVGESVCICEDAPQFLCALDRLISDENARRVLGGKAQEAARNNFSDNVCYGPIMDFVAAKRLRLP
jgi:glycosyltransferase involved in cell wall biosynthesis